tara:strand:- start:52 stop:843 length:792 start_codon:yes stop_codon:yes gene_type:complete
MNRYSFFLILAVSLASLANEESISNKGNNLANTKKMTNSHQDHDHNDHKKDSHKVHEHDDHKKESHKGHNHDDHNDDDHKNESHEEHDHSGHKDVGHKKDSHKGHNHNDHKEDDHKEESHKGHDHDEHAGHSEEGKEGHEHGHGNSKSIGPGKAIEVVDETKGFVLSQEAIETLSLRSIQVNSNNIVIPKEALIVSLDKKGIYRQRDKYYKFLDVEIRSEGQDTYTIFSSDIKTKDLIVTEGVGLLRVADIYSTDTSEYGHSH